MGSQVGWSEKGPRREENLVLAKRMLAQDLATVRTFRPAYALVQQLEDALVLDRSWAQEQLWKSTSTIWKVENALNIPLLRRVRSSHNVP